MTVLIGITQAPEKTEEYICMEYNGVGSRTIVGPFLSPEQASAWMHFMKDRAAGYREVAVPDQSGADNQWYGFTFELLETRAH